MVQLQENQKKGKSNWFIAQIGWVGTGFGPMKQKAKPNLLTGLDPLSFTKLYSELRTLTKRRRS